MQVFILKGSSMPFVIMAAALRRIYLHASYDNDLIQRSCDVGIVPEILMLHWLDRLGKERPQPHPMKLLIVDLGSEHRKLDQELWYLKARNFNGCTVIANNVFEMRDKLRSLFTEAVCAKVPALSNEKLDFGFLDSLMLKLQKGHMISDQLGFGFRIRANAELYDSRKLGPAIDFAGEILHALICKYAVQQLTSVK